MANELIIKNGVNVSGGITATTVSATTYQNLPVSALTAGTNISITNTSGNHTISVTGVTGGLTGEYLPLSGGTVTGSTTFTSSLNGRSLDISGSSSSSLVTLTQTGTGNVLTVEDSTRIDNTPFIINSGGSVSIGSSNVFSTPIGASEAKLSVSLGASGVSYSGLPITTSLVVESNQSTSIGIFSPNSATTYSQIYFGNTANAFLSLLRLDYTNRNFTLGTDNMATGKIVFLTNNAIEAARIDENGNLGIGLTSPTQKLHVSGNTIITSGLTASTISATTYQNLPVSALTAGTNISITNTSGNHTISVTGVTGGSSINPYNNSGSGSTISWDVSGVSTNYEATLTATTTLNLTNVRNGDFGTIIIKQDSVGSRTLTLGTISPSGTHRVANGGGGITLTSNPNAIDILTFTYNGSIMFWTVGNDYV